MKKANVIIFSVIFVSVILLMYIAMEYFKQETKKYNGICSFDLDGTLTVDIENAAKAISKCRELNYKITFNTARPTKWYSDLDKQRLGLNEDDFETDFYYGENYKCSFGNRKCLEDSIANTKVKHLHTLSNKWNIHPKYIILFDDQFSNIEMAKNSGFSTIYANNSHVGGLTDNVDEQIEKISM